MTPRPSRYSNVIQNAEAAIERFRHSQAAKPIASATPLAEMSDATYLQKHARLSRLPVAERLAGITALNREFILPRLTAESRQIAEKYFALADDPRQARRFAYWQKDNARELALARAEIGKLSTPTACPDRMQCVLK